MHGSKKITFIIFLLLTISSVIFVSLTPVAAQTYNIQITLGSGSSQNCVASNNCYNPDSSPVSSGTTVTWTNTDNVAHTVTSGHSSDNQTGTIFDSGLIKAGGTFSFTFKNPGTYPYFCLVHPWMTGQIVAVSVTSPSAPTMLTAIVSSSQINLSWGLPLNNGGSPITGYEIERSTNGGSTWDTIVTNSESTETTYSDTGLAASTTYMYRVSAINSAGPSQPSDIVSVTTLNTSIPNSTTTSPPSVPSSAVGTVSTDKASYYTGEDIIISGQVRNYSPNVGVAITIKNPNGNLVHVAQPDVAGDGTYTTTVTTGGQFWQISGTYTVSAFYGNNLLDTTNFNFAVQHPPTTTASPAGGTYTTSQTVTLTTDRSATIYYTTDGTIPTTSSPSGPSPLTLPQFTSTTTLKFFAVDASGNRESVKIETYTINIPPQPKDFSLSASSVTIEQGSTGSSTMTINPINGFNSPVTLSLSGNPPGVTGTFSPNPDSIASGNFQYPTSELTLNVDKSTQPDFYTLTVTGTGLGGSPTHTATFSLQITAPTPPQPPIPPWVVPVVIGLAATGTGIAIATKVAAAKGISAASKLASHSAIHSTQPQQSTDQKVVHQTTIPNIEIEIMVGIENGGSQSKSPTEISDKVGKDLRAPFDGIIKEYGGLDKLHGITTVMNWYDENKPTLDKLPQDQLDNIHDAGNVLNLAFEARKGRDAFRSKLSSIVVEKIMGQVSVPFVDTMIDQIRVKTEGKKKSVTFNVDFTRTILKPYIEFILKINGQKVASAKIDFEIDIEATMKDIEFEYAKDSSTIGLGRLEIGLTVSANFKIPLTGILESKQIGQKSFDIDLSKFHISL